MSDFNGDGFIDAVDTDGDGYLDTYDTDFDGFADTFDLDEDGFADGSVGGDEAGGYAGGYAGTDLDGDGLVDGNPNTYLDDDQYYTQAEQAQGYSASDTSLIEPADDAGSSSVIS